MVFIIEKLLIALVLINAVLINAVYMYCCSAAVQLALFAEGQPTEVATCHKTKTKKVLLKLLPIIKAYIVY